MQLQANKLAYSVEEFAEVTGLGRTAIYAAIKAKRLVARKHGGRTVILREEGIAFLQALPQREVA
jgi:excisionase family DNA binding protein